MYLAKDTMLNRWVVLKGLLNTTDESAAAAAVAERQFLAAVKHPNIVGIYNFVTRGTEGFIVMEYVNGTSVKTLRKERGRCRPPRPSRTCIVFSAPSPTCMARHGVLRHEARQLHARRRTAGRQADRHGRSAPDRRSRRRYLRYPRLQRRSREGPTVASDLYTIGRTLAVLLMEFRFQSVYEFDLPPPAEQEVLARYDSLNRFLLKATQRHPNLRFQSADEMADQLAGVLRDVVAGTRPPQPVESTLFQGDLLAMNEELDSPRHELLPDLKVRTDDPGAAYLLSIAGASDMRRRDLMLEQGIRQLPDSRELHLRSARNLVDLGSYAKAGEVLDRAEKEDPFDWRVAWYRGYSLLAQGQPAAACTVFDQVYNELPGEPAVKLCSPWRLKARAMISPQSASTIWSRPSIPAS